MILYKEKDTEYVCDNCDLVKPAVIEFINTMVCKECLEDALNIIKSIK